MSGDEAKGDESQELLAFYSKCKKLARCSQQEGEHGETGAKGRGGQVGGCCWSPRQQSQIKF